MKEEKYKKFEDQFNFSESDYLHQTDFLNWYRHFFVIKEIFDFEPQKILEMGSGNGIVKNSLKSIIGEYKTMDINKELKPDYLSDIRNFNPELKEKFDCVLATDILEHIPYGDMAKSLENIFLYRLSLSFGIIKIYQKIWRKSNKKVVSFMVISSFYLL